MRFGLVSKPSRILSRTPMCDNVSVIAYLRNHLSRRDQFLKTEWSLNPAVARRVFRVWGSPHVDLFALKCNTKLATYMSPIPEPRGLEGRQSSPIVGRSVRLRVPTNGSDQTDSEQA